MDQWIFWLVTTAVMLLVGAIGYFVKRTLDQIVISIKGLESRICDLEQKWAGLPFIYTLREDFIRAMSGVENKLNKILDRLPAAKGE